MASKLAKELTPGDVIPPPAHERKWLWRDGVKRMLTVVSVSDGRVDKGGLWLDVKANFGSPYGDKTSDGVFSMRPETKVSVA